MKRAAIISLLLILFVSQIGYHFIMEFCREVYKENLIKAIIPKLNDEELTKIDAGNKAIVWLEDDKEFKVGNSMYDVVKVSVENGKTILYCLADKDEERLIEKHNQLIKETSSPFNEGKNGKHISVNAFPDFIIADNSLLYNHPLLQYSDNAYLYYNHRTLATSAIDILTPPPKV